MSPGYGREPDITRRDPGDHAHGGEQPDYVRTAIWLLVLGAAGYAGYKLVIEPKLAAAAANNALPPAPPSGGGGGALPPNQQGTFFGGDQAEQGDVIYVNPSGLDPSVLATTILGSVLSSQLPTSLVMVVTSATPGETPLQAITTAASQPVPAGIQLPVPRSAITTTVRGAPSSLPGLPSIPGLPSVPGILPADIGSPMPIKQGHKYRARLQLDAMTAMLATPQLVSQQFTGFGFGDVHVYGASDQLPADWPEGTVVLPSSATYYAEGTWPGADASVSRPPEIVYAWEAP